MIDFVALISTGLICYWVNMAEGIGMGVCVTLLGNALVILRQIGDGAVDVCKIALHKRARSRKNEGRERALVKY